jgi:hypothetical protein
VHEAFESPARGLDDFGLSLNTHPLEDSLHNFTSRAGYHRFDPILSIDYSSNSPATEGQTVSDTTGEVNSSASTILEFPSLVILSLFMSVTLLLLLVVKRKHVKH